MSTQYRFDIYIDGLGFFQVYVSASVWLII